MLNGTDVICKLFRKLFSKQIYLKVVFITTDISCVNYFYVVILIDNIFITVRVTIRLEFKLVQARILKFISDILKYHVSFTCRNT